MISISTFKGDFDSVVERMNICIMQMCNILEKMKIVIGNDLANCRRSGCTVENPCSVCRELRRLDKEIDELINEYKEKSQNGRGRS